MNPFKGESADLFALNTKEEADSCINKIMSSIGQKQYEKFVKDMTDIQMPSSLNHTGKCIRRFGGIYAYCRYFIDRKW